MNINLSKEFGVPEDVEFTISEKGILYKIHNNILLGLIDSEWGESILGINYINNHEANVVPVVITDAEEVILENLPEKYRNGWVARGTYGENIFAYTSEPSSLYGYYETENGNSVLLPYNHLFSSIQYDTGAKKISELLEQKKRSKE